MITKEKNRTKIICAVVTAISAIVAGGSAFQLYNVQNISQTVNGNVIQILGETGSYVSAGTDLTDSTDELISAYRKVLDENSQYQANQSTLQGQVQSLQNENDDLKNQIQILKGTLLNTYSSDEINSVIEQGGLKRDISKRLDNLECLDSVHCEQVPSVKDLYGTTHSVSYRFDASDTAWAKFKLDGQYDTFSANIVTSEDTNRDANIHWASAFRVRPAQCCPKRCWLFVVLKSAKPLWGWALQKLLLPLLIRKLPPAIPLQAGFPAW